MSSLTKINLLHPKTKERLKSELSNVQSVALNEIQDRVLRETTPTEKTCELVEQLGLDDDREKTILIGWINSRDSDAVITWIKERYLD